MLFWNPKTGTFPNSIPVLWLVLLVKSPCFTIIIYTLDIHIQRAYIKATFRTVATRWGYYGPEVSWKTLINYRYIILSPPKSSLEAKS